MLWGAMRVMDSSGNLAQRPPVWMVYPLDLSPGGRWILAAWAAIGLLGVFVQLRFTGTIESAGASESTESKVVGSR